MRFEVFVNLVGGFSVQMVKQDAECRNDRSDHYGEENEVSQVPAYHGSNIDHFGSFMR